MTNKKRINAQVLDFTCEPVINIQKFGDVQTPIPPIVIKNSSGPSLFEVSYLFFSLAPSLPPFFVQYFFRETYHSLSLDGESL